MLSPILVLSASDDRPGIIYFLFSNLQSDRDHKSLMRKNDDGRDRMQDYIEETTLLFLQNHTSQAILRREEISSTRSSE
jgi:hypothetical protein